MDALQGVLYHKDVMITKGIITNLFGKNINAGGWTDVQFSTSSQASPLAVGFWI
jgi:hypothetical protein